MDRVARSYCGRSIHSIKNPYALNLIAFEFCCGTAYILLFLWQP
jgi:hypothetical protein